MSYIETHGVGESDMFSLATSPMPESAVSNVLPTISPRKRGLLIPCVVHLRELPITKYNNCTDCTGK